MSRASRRSANRKEAAASRRTTRGSKEPKQRRRRPPGQMFVSWRAPDVGHVEAADSGQVLRREIRQRGLGACQHAGEEPLEIGLDERAPRLQLRTTANEAGGGAESVHLPRP